MKTFDFPIFLNPGRILQLKTFDFAVFLAVTESLSLTEDNHWRNLEDESQAQESAREISKIWGDLQPCPPLQFQALQVVQIWTT